MTELAQSIAEPEVTDPVVLLKDVTLTFAGVTALSEVSFEVHPGEWNILS